MPTKPIPRKYLGKYLICPHGETLWIVKERTHLFFWERAFGYYNTIQEAKEVIDKHILTLIRIEAHEKKEKIIYP